VDVKKMENDLKNSPNFYGVASLKKYTKHETPMIFVQMFLEELEKIFDLLNKRQIKKIIKEWTERSSTLGKIVELNTDDGKVRGRAIKIDDDGALVVDDKKNIRVLAGDISHVEN
ncbi:MAG: biotin--[acetyl-CoA-carboxylase] ligase, partial [Nitrosopumilus sp.]|nr:biotin--[acetyl-CoA-carboxylase] ligase [Nitrosopumilus sp.]